MQNLTQELQEVYNSVSIEDKKKTATDFINKSHAASDKKLQSINSLNQLTNTNKIDKFVTNYMLSGEGMKVL